MKPCKSSVRNVLQTTVMLSFVLDAYLAFGLFSVARVLFVQLGRSRAAAS